MIVGLIGCLSSLKTIDTVRIYVVNGYDFLIQEKILVFENK